MGRRHAEIAGAGIAGLTFAAVLAQRGWSVTVHERASELREIGAGIFIWPNGVRALQSIGALDSAAAGGTRLDYWNIVDERGRVLQGAFMDAPAYSVARTELHGGLAHAARAAGAEIVAGSEISGAGSSGALVTARGERRTADLVVGADGIGSSVRRALGIRAKLIDLGYGSQRTFVPRIDDDPQASNPEWWYGRRRLGISPCGPDRTYVYMFCPPDDIAGRRAALDRATWSASFPKAASIVERLPATTEWRESVDLQCERWSTGRAVLLGDAAHAMAPNWGQGANSTMLSAVVLGEVLDDAPDVPTALRAWENRHRAVVDRVQRYSRIYSHAMTRWPSRLLAMRSACVWSTAHSKTFRRRVMGAA